MSTKPEVLAFADVRPASTDDGLAPWAVGAEGWLRRQHAEIERLTKERDALRGVPTELIACLIDARDDVAAELQRCREAAGYPSTDRRLAAQETLIARVDSAIAAADEWLAQQRGPLTDEQNSADAARWREMRRVFRVAEHIGATTGMPATKLSCHWYGWATGNHADVTGCVDALISERARGIGQPAGEDKPC